MNRASSNLPLTIDPWRLTAPPLTGTVLLSELPRLAKLLLNPQAQAWLSLCGGVDDNGTKLLRLHIKTTLRLSCQRCLDPLELDLELTPELALAASEADAARLPERYEPLLCDKPLSPIELLEDELLLALPQVPKHADTAVCGPLWQQAKPVPAASSEPAQHTHKPFAALSSLLKDE